MLSKEQIISAGDLPTKVVDVPEWGGEVCVRSMTGTERDIFETETYGDGGVGTENIRARLSALCMCDENGTRIFDDDEVDELGRKSAKALDRVFAVAKSINGFSADDIAELEKN